jgi:spore maturation protein CgeB
MKFLFLGYHNPHFISLPEYIENAITSLGYELEVFDYRKWLIPGRIRQRFPFLDKLDSLRINNRLIARVHKTMPDVILANGAWTVLPDTIRTIRSCSNSRTALWIADFPAKFPEFQKAGPAYHHFFASGTDALKRYAACGGHNGSWLPFAADPVMHAPVQLTEEDKRKYGHDICYVGSRVSERVELLEQLCDFDLGVWGAGWDSLPGKSPLRSRVCGGPVTPDVWTKIFAASKIVLNIIGHRCDVMEPFIEENEFRMTNTKVFEILGCGAFQMVDAKADAVSLFEDKKHLVYYRNAHELRDLISYYLAHPQERSSIARTGRAEVLQKHTYRHRVEKIIFTLSPEAAACRH